MDFEPTNCKPLPPKEFLLKTFAYDPISGDVWRRSNGKILYAMNGNGYLTVFIDGEKYSLHRIIWKMQTGVDPTAEIDHKDLNKSNNAWSNLREATTRENSFNVKGRNKCKGVSWAEHAKKYVAHIRINGRKKHLGYFITEEAASEAYKEAAAKLHGEFIRV